VWNSDTKRLAQVSTLSLNSEVFDPSLAREGKQNITPSQLIDKKVKFEESGKKSIKKNKLQSERLKIRNLQNFA
jgi:hypothetical protein